MTSKVFVIASVTALLAGVVFATPHGVVTPTEAPSVVEIPVAAADLERCIATLEAVFIAPVHGNAVQSVSLQNTPAPMVKCVIKGAAT